MILMFHMILGLEEKCSCVKTASWLVQIQRSRKESGRSAWAVNLAVLQSTCLQTRAISTGFYISYQPKLRIRKARPRKCMTDTYCLFFAVNAKFSFNWCVFAYPDKTNLTDAGIAYAKTCQGPDYNAKAALVDRFMRVNVTLQYQYCKTENSAFAKVADDCVKCLQKAPNSKAMANCTFIMLIECRILNFTATDIRWDGIL